MLMDGKTRAQLDELQKEIQATIDGRSSSAEIVDVPFMESLLKVCALALVCVVLTGDS